MITKYDEPLKNYSHMRIGGIAQTMFFPETTTELTELLRSSKFQYFIANGSNTLINDKKVFDAVVCLKKFNTAIHRVNDDGSYIVGASVSLQTLIKTIHHDGVGGIEYLYSVPGTVGGAIYMNAGRGRKQGMFISNHLVSVTVCDYSGNTFVLSKQDCDFSYRKSIFQRRDWIILDACLKFEKAPPEVLAAKISERLSFTKDSHDLGKPNLGSVFKVYDSRIISVLKKFHFGFKNGVHFSGKTNNWFVNEGHGTFTQAMFLIKCVRFFHFLIGKRIEEEICIWY